MVNMISQSMMNALGTLVSDVPYYVTMVELDCDQYFIILGKSHFYFVDSSLRDHTADAPGRTFAYADLLKVKCDRRRPNLLQLILR